MTFGYYHKAVAVSYAIKNVCANDRACTATDILLTLGAHAQQGLR